MTKRKSTFRLLAFAAALAALQGCGGGGGGFPITLVPAGNSDSQTQTESKVPETDTSSPAPTPETTPETTPTDRYAPVAGSEPAPSLSDPQKGSTADVGSASEGIYESFFGHTFITAAGQLARKDLLDWTWGSITVNGTDWSFNPETRSLHITSKTVTGSGTFTSRTSMQGTYSEDGGASSAWGPLKYSQANALAITLANLQGKWSVADATRYNMSLEFDANGVLSGTTSGPQLGVCSLSGAAVQVEPGTAKNMFYLAMTAVNAATGSERACTLDTSLPFAGLAGVVLTAAGIYPQNGYFRTFAFHVKTPNLHLLTNYLRKEQ
ncbi:hypothetical protein VAR608DRAFT_1692 [Variovorax sp. HW608]|uniref:hypothetical protein n=1 Tax=Variovorax sp. HW608 TaxID=1034889 RepID=UPI00081FA3E2|nr:hypothetical protein [Variovorax sp. HW608]SCK21911.1 hypothetical protein VAR608DRAFT_1692 [Variovorax sp. HW608]